MMFPFSIAVTVERPTGTDRHGNPLPPEVHDLPGCILAPGGSSEQTGDSAQVTWELDLLTTDPAADVRHGDSVLVVDGPYGSGDPAEPFRYAVDGMPRFFRNPWTGDGGTLARLQGVRG